MSWVRSPPCQLETLDLLFQNTPRQKRLGKGVYDRRKRISDLYVTKGKLLCRGCGLENRLDVKVSGVQIPNTAWQSKGYVRFVGVWVARSLSKTNRERNGSIPRCEVAFYFVVLALWYKGYYARLSIGKFGFDSQ